MPLPHVSDVPKSSKSSVSRPSTHLPPPSTRYVRCASSAPPSEPVRNVVDNEAPLLQNMLKNKEFRSDLEHLIDMKVIDTTLAIVDWRTALT